MGNDGGSIPKRRELVKEAARLPSASELKASAIETLTHLWTTCAVSSDPLDYRNVVSDWRGRLYNYETVLQHLIPAAAADDKTTSSSPHDDNNTGPGDDGERRQAAEFARTGIRSLKDVVKLKFSLRRQSENDGGSSSNNNNNNNHNYKRDKNEKRSGEVPTCPLSMKDLGATTRAVYIVPCGHVFAEIAIRQLLAAEGHDTNTNTNTDSAEKKKEKEMSCPECSEPFLPDRDIVPVVPIEEADLDRCAARLEELRALGLAHNLKKDKSANGGSSNNNKKKKRKAAAEGDKENGNGNGNGDGAQKEKKQKKNSSNSNSNGNRDDISSRINNSMTASLTAKVLAEQEERNKQRKLAATVR
ncbi:Rtf2 RING-finger-domain-containing protein [Xylariaceae sp. FL0594]|nr:Rtf2 RING-finger-domain-containing protein [Xylariaceae sp. FL0594]